jgi:hypothetical protein
MVYSPNVQFTMAWRGLIVCDKVTKLWRGGFIRVLVVK